MNLLEIVQADWLLISLLIIGGILIGNWVGKYINGK